MTMTRWMARAVAVLAAMGLAVGMAVPVVAFNAQYSSGSAGISVDENGDTVTFTDNHSGGSTDAFNARWIVIVARSGGDACYYDPDGTATTSDHRLLAGATARLIFDRTSGGNGWPSIGYICAAGESATWDISAGR